VIHSPLGDPLDVVRLDERLEVFAVGIAVLGEPATKIDARLKSVLKFGHTP